MQITKMLAPINCNGARSGIKRTRNGGVTIHNTGNYAHGSGALNHGKYLQGGGANTQTSWHYTVDDTYWVQSIPDDEVAWHAGDGQGNGNMTTIAIEICVNPDSDLRKATDNAAMLAAQKLKEQGLGIGCLYQHHDWSGKNCPAEIRNGNPYNWATFKDKVASYLGQSSTDDPVTDADVPQTSEKYSIGIPVCVKQLCTSSTGGKIANGHWTNGVIGSIVHGAKYPYRIDRDGTPIGWVNDAIIDADPHIPGSAPVHDPVTPQPSGRWTDQVFEVGSYAKLRGIFRVDQVLEDRDSIWCEELTGDGGNSIQAGPLTKCDANGNRTANQVFKVGDYFYCDEKFKVLGVDAKTDAIKINVGGRVIWVYAGPCDEVI